MTVGEPIFDDLKVSGTSGATITGKWWIHDPVKPKMVNGKPSRRELNWKHSSLVDKGELKVTDDGTHKAGGPKVQELGCYFYREELPPTATSEGVSTLVGSTPRPPWSRSPHATTPQVTTARTTTPAKRIRRQRQRHPSAAWHRPPSGILTAAIRGGLLLAAGLFLSGLAWRRNRAEVRPRIARPRRLSVMRRYTEAGGARSATPDGRQEKSQRSPLLPTCGSRGDRPARGTPKVPYSGYTMTHIDMAY